MPINFPAHVIVEGFGDCISFLRHTDSDVVFETSLADVLQKGLEVGNFHHAVAAEGIKFVICKFTLANVNADNTSGIIGGGSAESCLAGFYPADDGAEGVFLADGACNNLLVVHLWVLEE